MGRILTLVPAESPALQLRLVLLEELGSRDTSFTLLGDGECEVGVRLAHARLSAVDRGVNLKTDIKELTGKEVRPMVGLKELLLAGAHKLIDITEVTQDTYWSGGKTQPRSGQPPRRW